MANITFRLVSVLLVSASVAFAAPPAGGDGSPQLIAFGSCAHQELPQPFWSAVLAEGPDLFVFLGDNVYADTEDPGEMRRAYARLAARPGWRELVARVPVLATWDDHDYGANDAGAEYPLKEVSARIHLDFFGVPASSPRRLRPGVYGAEMLGPPGRRVQVILLDTRTFRGPLQKREGGGPGGPYVPNRDASVTMLGEAQWAWLERELRRPADLRLLVSGIQVLPEEHGWEKWANLPHERRRLLDLLRETRAEGVLILSGDRHHAEISVLPAEAPHGIGYDLVEVTSSSLNRPLAFKGSDEPNRWREGAMFTGANYGTLKIHWGPGAPVLRAAVHDGQGEIRLSRLIPLDGLARETR